MEYKVAGTPKDVLQKIMELDMNKTYIFEIKEPKSKRSIQQNKMLWEFIGQIAKQTKHDDMEIYCALLERANAKSDYIIAIPEAEETLRKRFRGVRFIRKQKVNNTIMNVYKIYLGSSTMNTKEMAELLEIAIQICSELGIPTIREW